MGNEIKDSSRITDHGSRIKHFCGDFELDHKALAGAVGLMCISWAALPVVYWLIVRKKNGEKIDGTGKVHSESKEAEKK